MKPKVWTICVRTNGLIPYQESHCLKKCLSCQNIWQRPDWLMANSRASARLTLLLALHLAGLEKSPEELIEGEWTFRDVRDRLKISLIWRDRFSYHSPYSTPDLTLARSLASLPRFHSNEHDCEEALMSNCSFRGLKNQLANEFENQFDFDYHKGNFPHMSTNHKINFHPREINPNLIDVISNSVNFSLWSNPVSLRSSEEERVIHEWKKIQERNKFQSRD